MNKYGEVMPTCLGCSPARRYPSSNHVAAPGAIRSSSALRLASSWTRSAA